jgi:hypothetical protein
MARDQSSYQIAKEFAEQALKLSPKQRWEKIFILDEIVSGYNRTDYVERALAGDANIFGESFRTDGVDIIFQIRRRKTAEQIRLQKLRSHIRIQDRRLENRIHAAKKNHLSHLLHDRRLVKGERALLEKRDVEIAKMRKDFAEGRYNTIIGIDPGQKNPITAVEYTKMAEEHLRGDPASRCFFFLIVRFLFCFFLLIYFFSASSSSSSFYSERWHLPFLVKFKGGPY